MKNIRNLMLIALLAMSILSMQQQASAQERKPKAKQEQQFKKQPRKQRQARRAMRSKDFDTLHKIVKEASFDKDKKNIISIACIGNRFDTRQCISLLSLFDFENSKLEVLEIIAPRLAEREKAYEILEQFTFSSHKEKAADILLKAQHKKRKKN